MTYVLLVRNDRVLARDGKEHIVEAYTRLGDSPEIYVRVGEDEEALTVRFRDVSHINGTPVSFDRASNCFRALGTLRRKYPLPQPGDTLTDERGVEHKVASVRLQKKRYGEMRGLFIIADDKTAVNIKNVRGLVFHDSGLELKNVGGLQAYYIDYLPLKPSDDDRRDSREDAI